MTPNQQNLVFLLWSLTKEKSKNARRLVIMPRRKRKKEEGIRSGLQKGGKTQTSKC